MPRYRETLVYENTFQPSVPTAGQRHKADLGKLPTRGPHKGLYVLDRLRIKSPTLTQTVPAGKSLDAYSLGQTLQIGLLLATASPFARGECRQEIIPEGTWMTDLMRVWALAMGRKLVRGGNGRLRAPQIAAADVTTPLDVYVAIKEQDDRVAFPQHQGPMGGDGGGGGAAFSARIEWTLSFVRRGENPKRGIPLAHLNGDFPGNDGAGVSAGTLSIGIPPTLKMDNTTFAYGAEGWEILFDVIELDPSEVVVPVIPRVIVDQYNAKNFSLSKPSLPKDVICSVPEHSSGDQTAEVITTAYVTQDGSNLADPTGDMARHANAIADQLEDIGERWAYPASQAALTSTCNTIRLLRDVTILATAVNRGMPDLIPPGKIQVNMQSATIPSGGFRILQLAWDPGDASVQVESAAKLGGDPKQIEPATKNGNPAMASKGWNLPKVTKAVAEVLSKG